MANVNHLRERAELLRHTRSYFDQHEFLEVQPPCLCRDCVVDAYLDPIVVDRQQLKIATDNIADNYYLQTSPESAMKRMLAAGAPSIYSVGPVFRSGEAGKHHNIEFTMLEWYERDGDQESAIKLLGDYVAGCMGKNGFDRATYRGLFQMEFGLDPINASLQEIQGVVRTTLPSYTIDGSIDRDDLLDVLLSEKIAPKLGMDLPMIVTDYPLSQAALANVSKDDPQCAARFELFAKGIEIANGYDELLDAEVLIERAKENNLKRKRSGRETLSVETTLVQAMRKGLPACSGVAVGIDRLLMLTTGAKSIDDVIALTIQNA